MEAFGFMAWIILVWAWYYPEKLGAWLARVRSALNAGGE